MIGSGAIPQAVLATTAAATIFTVMFSLGLAIDVRDLRWAWSRPWLVARGWLSVVVCVPIAGVAVAHALGLSLAAQVGVALMAVSPGAPVALRRSLDAGSHHSLATVLQVLVAALAIVSMPVSVAALNWFFGTHGSISPTLVARQVFQAQLLPLGLGLLVRRATPWAARSEPIVRRTAAVMLMALALLVIAAVWRVVLEAEPGTGVAAVVVTLLALAIGHAMGAPSGETRTAVAILSAVRNPGLALLVATSNHAPPEVISTVVVYLLWTAITVTPYAIWRHRVRDGRSS